MQEMKTPEELDYSESQDIQSVFIECAKVKEECDFMEGMEDDKSIKTHSMLIEDLV